jgi:hypothetical protein
MDEKKPSEDRKPDEPDRRKAIGKLAKYTAILPVTTVLFSKDAKAGAAGSGT